MNAKEAAEITLKVMREKASKDMALATMLMADVCETPVEKRQSDTWADEMGIAVANVRAKL